MGSASLPGRHVMANVLRGELNAMGDVILQLTTGNVLILGDAFTKINNAMGNAQLEVLLVETESASVTIIQTAMETGIIEDVVIPVYTNRNLVKIHVLPVTTSANTSIDMEAMIDAYPSITFKEVITCTVEIKIVINVHLATTSRYVQLTRTALVLIPLLHHSYQLRHLLPAHVLQHQQLNQQQQDQQQLDQQQLDQQQLHLLLLHQPLLQ